MPEYVACWPIVNDAMHRSELIREASRDLDLMLCEEGLVRAGEPAWTIDGLQLQCRVDVDEWVDPLLGWDNPYVPESNIDRAALLAAQGRTHSQIAVEMRVTRRSVERYLAAAFAGAAA